MDRYLNFGQLKRNETYGEDYRIRIEDMGAAITIAAPHAGRIEPGTGLIARLAAGRWFNWYCFEGIKNENNASLHITSHRFDEPSGIELFSKSETVVTIHACKDEEPVIYVGGRHTTLGDCLRQCLDHIGIDSPGCQDMYPGRHPNNICNLGRLNKGVQIEISRGIRDDFPTLYQVAGAIQQALIKYQPTSRSA